MHSFTYSSNSLYFSSCNDLIIHLSIFNSSFSTHLPNSSLIHISLHLQNIRISTSISNFNKSIAKICCMRRYLCNVKDRWCHSPVENTASSQCRQPTLQRPATSGVNCPQRSDITHLAGCSALRRLWRMLVVMCVTGWLALKGDTFLCEDEGFIDTGGGDDCQWLHMDLSFFSYLLSFFFITSWL